jgi:CheY-like chemotaxis protein
MVPAGAPPRPPSGMRPRTARVLVVDDESTFLDSIRRLLSPEFEVTVAALPEIALDRLASGESFDVILCDVMMPRMTGVDLRDRVHAFAPEQAARIVFITGGLPLPHVRALIDRTPNTCLEKPIDPEGLRELIRRRVRIDWREADGGL